MKPHPSRYSASASARAIGSLIICAPGLSATDAAAPPEFAGPDGAWPPEILLCAALASCFVLSFRGVARAAHFNWIALDCGVEGELKRTRDMTQFTRFTTAVRLGIPPGADRAKARFLLGRAEQACLIANSIRGERTLSTELVMTLEPASIAPGSRTEPPLTASTSEGVVLEAS